MSAARSEALHLLRALDARLSEAVEQARLTYTFVPGSYAYSCLSACSAAQRCLEDLRAALVEANVGDADADR